MAIALTTATPAQVLASQVQTIANNLISTQAQQLTRLFNLIWSNPDQTNLSPDKAWAAFGTNAVTLRTALLASITHLNQIHSGLVSLTEPSTWTITQNTDGSITCVAAS